MVDDSNGPAFDLLHLVQDPTQLGR